MVDAVREQQTERKFRLFTEGKEPGIDAMAIMAQLLQELQDNERMAALGYFADLYGYRLVLKSRY